MMWLVYLLMNHLEQIKYIVNELQLKIIQLHGDKVRQLVDQLALIYR